MASSIDQTSTDKQTFEKMLSDEYGVDIPFSNELCNFETLTETEDHTLPNLNASNLDSSLLNKGMQSPKALCSSQREKEEAAMKSEPVAAHTPDPAISEQLQVFPRSTQHQGTRGVWSPPSHDGLNINTNPTNPFNYPPQTQVPRPPFLTRPNSFLRHQYNPWAQNGSSSPLINNNYSLFDNHNSLLIGTNSASHNIGQLQHNSRASAMVHQARQPFEESNLRSPLTQSPNYNMPHQPKSHYYTRCPDSPIFSPDAHFRSPHIDFNTPGLPRTPPSISHVSHFQHTPTMSASSLKSINREASSPASPRPQVKREPSTGKRRHAAMQIDPSFDNVQLPRIRLPQEDRSLVEELIAAMTDGHDAEDNVGMIKTWDKIRLAKADKLREKAREMLELVRRAEREDVSEKKAIHQYESFEHRYDELCKALKTQKTICKHLMEEEYSCIVANDPTYAAQRVKNNRRVNDQKKIAIEVGREMMGEKGRGKGRNVEKVPSVTYVEEDENSADDAMSEEDSYAFPEIKSEPRSRKKAKKTRRTSMDDDSDFIMKTPSASKKAKRQSRSAYKPTNNGNTPSTSRSLRTTRNACHTEDGDEASQAMNGSPTIHRSQHVQDQYDGYGYNNYQQHHYAPSMGHGLPSMVPELPRDMFGPSPGYQHPPLDQHTPYSSGTDPTYASDYHGNDGTDTNGYGDGSYGDDLFGPARG